MAVIIVDDGVEYMPAGYFKPKVGELYLTSFNTVKKCEGSIKHEHLVLKKKRWKPKAGDMYFFVAPTGKVDRRIYDESLAASLMIEQGNCFKTYDEAEEASTKIKALLAQ